MADGFTPPHNQQPPQAGGFPPPPPPNFGQPGQFTPPAGQFGQPTYPSQSGFSPQAGGFPPPPGFSQQPGQFTPPAGQFAGQFAQPQAGGFPPPPPNFDQQGQQFTPPPPAGQFAQPQYGHGNYVPMAGQYGGGGFPPPPGFGQQPGQFTPPTGQPGMPTPPAPGAPAVPAIDSPLQSDEELSEDQFITGGDNHDFIKTIPIPPHPATQFDEKKFLELLAGSISLTKTEKQRIISSIPKLSQYQIDELMRIFTEEQKKFQELNAKHLDQVKQLEESHKNDWQDIEMQAKQQTQKQKDDEDAAALRKKLGLG